MRYKKVAWAKNQRKKTILYIVTIIVLAMILQVVLMALLNEKNSLRTVTVLLDQVSGILVENRHREQEMVESLKEEYISRAKTLAHILDGYSEAEQDIRELVRLTEFMGIDEIHLFDESGTIYGGTEPKYYGLDFDSGEQISYFKPMLEDKTLSMCQNVTPNTAENKSMMYAITWNETGTWMIQVGIEPLRLLEELKNNEIPQVLDNMPTYEGIDIYVADSRDRVVLGATDRNMVGKPLGSTGFPVAQELQEEIVSGRINADGYRQYYEYRQVGDYIVLVTSSTEANLKNFLVVFGIELIYLSLAGVTIYYVLHKLIQANQDKKEQLSILISMADIYYSMHLIDLEQNTAREYKANNERKNVVDYPQGADEEMTRIMSGASIPEHREGILQFTDLHTLVERMQNKKMISREFMGVSQCWFRASFITIEADEACRPVKVMYVTRNIDNEKKKEEVLIARSNTDELTGLLNRRAYEEDIAAMEKETRENLVYISMDVNGLKVVNDSLGHAAGDELLLGACECMKQCLGPYGRLYRTGGDEFVALIHAKGDELGDICRDFEETSQAWSGKLVEHLTISYGCVTSEEDERYSLREMSLLADRRMYQAKNSYYQSKGVDRKGQKEAHTVLCALYTKILKINLTQDSYQIVNIDPLEQNGEMGRPEKISDWLMEFGEAGLVHPEDREEFLSKTNLEYLRSYFRRNKNRLSIFYRRKSHEDYRQVMMEIVPSGDYREDNQSLFLYVKDIGNIEVKAVRR